MPDHRQPTEADLSADAMHQIREAMQEAVQEAVRAGLRDALTDREVLALFWGSAFEAMQSRATKTTGAFVLGGIRGAASKLFWLMFLGAVAYQVGGMATLSTMWKAVTAAGAAD